MNETQKKYIENADFREGYSQCIDDIKELISNIEKDEGKIDYSLRGLSYMLTALRYERTCAAFEYLLKNR